VTTKIKSPVEHQMHGALFASYVAPARGSAELCAWRVRVEPDVQGQAHRVSHEEVFLVLAGTPTITVDGDRDRLETGDVVFAAAGSSVRLDNDGDLAAELWVTTSVGLTAQMADGTEIVPPWVR
jgi:quercetin dioxygenase-like cupin family protein